MTWATFLLRLVLERLTSQRSLLGVSWPNPSKSWFLSLLSNLKTKNKWITNNSRSRSTNQIHRIRLWINKTINNNNQSISNKFNNLPQQLTLMQAIPYSVRVLSLLGDRVEKLVHSSRRVCSMNLLQLAKRWLVPDPTWLPWCTVVILVRPALLDCLHLMPSLVAQHLRTKCPIHYGTMKMTLKVSLRINHKKLKQTQERLSQRKEDSSTTWTIPTLMTFQRKPHQLRQEKIQLKSQTCLIRMNLTVILLFLLQNPVWCKRINHHPQIKSLLFWIQMKVMNQWRNNLLKLNLRPLRNLL